MAIKVDLSAVEQIIREVGAAEIMPRFRKLAEGDIEMKAMDDPVTIADKETEKRLAERLTAYLPGSVAVGEEAYARDRDLVLRLGGEQPAWVIDPIDGTRNFVSGQPEFAVMVGLVYNKKAIAGWIHDPNTGDTVMGEEGSGVWLRGNKLRLAATDEAIRRVGLVGSRIKRLVSDSYTISEGHELFHVEAGSCAGFDYPRLFSGTVSFANDPSPRAAFAVYRHTNPWDHVPGLFLHQEAGGYSADWAGEPYDMIEPRRGLLLAGSREKWETLYMAFKPLIQSALSKFR